MRKRLTLVTCACAVVAVSGCGSDNTPAENPAETVRLYDGLGDHHHAITTASETTQQYFDQGVRLTYGFNHAEAIRSFREAARLDAECAMCYWGEALAFGPNINAAMDSASGVAAYAAVQRAQELAQNASEVERAYIDALARRYAMEPTAPRPPLDTAYAMAMVDIATRWPEDDDAAVLAADALMNLSPWDYWVGDESPVAKPNAARAIELLEGVLARSPDHAGACHFFIHAVEAAYPERAVACAERLPDLMPAAGHVVHMPAHIYIRVGRYADAVERNEHAVHADEAMLQDFAPDGVYRLAYYPHNYHFLWFAASMAGRAELAIDAARNTAAQVDESLMREPGLGALQHYLITPLFALVRFGQWDAILAEPAPPEDLPYPTGIMHYARALAYIGKDSLPSAERELAALDAQRADPALQTVTIWELNGAAPLLEIAREAVAGEIAAKRGDVAGAVAHLERAREVEDGLTYDEPPTWHLPVRQQLGAVLLNAGRAAEAETAYRQDLRRHPENGWSLFGLEESLRAQGKTAEAQDAMQRFEQAWTSADVTLTESRF